MNLVIWKLSAHDERRVEMGVTVLVDCYVKVTTKAFQTVLAEYIYYMYVKYN